MTYPYDDSGVIEAVEMLDEEEINRIYSYAIKTNNLNLLKDKRWYEYFEELL